MELNGKILQIFEVKQISEKFSIQDFLIETTGEYPKKVLIQANVPVRPYLLKLGVGNSAKFEFDAESRESNGKWYTSLKCYKITEQK